MSGRRVVGFDNERGKGDHKHFGDHEESYVFVDVERLIDDFIQEVERWKSEH
ncbi:toxin-antitoxin system TumE family protein [Zoogloea oryzae]|uniref:toxin-antitoxin system TumE family protein n=1 Tax=Zoogloea oryzae TaxID=310767 RepID=UPI0034D34A9E